MKSTRRRNRVDVLFLFLRMYRGQFCVCACVCVSLAVNLIPNMYPSKKGAHWYSVGAVDEFESDRLWIGDRYPDTNARLCGMPDEEL